jgi:hypothetical protein
MDWTFAPKWKEELVCTCPQGSLILEFTMGRATVYFPTAERWRSQAPDWAVPLRDEMESALRTWCAVQGIPVVMDGSAALTAPAVAGG